MSKNLSALMDIVKYIYQTMVYAEVNTKSDYCQKCGYDIVTGKQIGRAHV